VSNPVPRLRRLLSIIPMIQRRGSVSLSELQETLGVSRRELQGDLNAIMLCGVPPYLPNDYISVFIDDDKVTIDYAQHFSRPARLTLPEALALRLAISRLQVPENGPLYEASQELLTALDRVMLGEDFASLANSIEGREAEQVSPKLAAIDRAVEDQLLLRFTYYSPSSEQVTPRQVRPYGRGDRGGNQYLIAYCEERRDVRTFRVDRISELELDEGGDPFLLPLQFDLSAHLSKIGPKPGEGEHLRLRLDHAIVRFETEDLDEASLEHLPNGDVVVSRDCGSVDWAVSDCLHRGEHAEILEPPEARANLCARLQAFLAQS